METILDKLHITKEDLNSLYRAGLRGKIVAENIRQWFNLDPEDMRPIGEQLWEQEILTQEEADYLDDK